VPLSFFACFASCRGVIDNLGEAEPGASLPEGTTTAELLPSRIRRLTNAEFDRSVQALLGTAKTPGTTFVPDTRQAGYTVNAGQRVDPVFAGQLQLAAADLAHEAATERLATLVPCSGSGDDDCARQFIESFGAKAYRRPLTADESADLFGIYQVGVDGGTFADGIEAVITAALQSASFLYVTELGASPASLEVELGPYEIASTLSYLMIGAPPDDALLAAAAAGTLADAAGREAQARRLLEDPRAKTQMARAVEEWLGIDKLAVTDKDSTVYQEFHDLRPAMLQETQSFIESVIFPPGSGTLGELLTADYTVAPPNLLAFYGTTAAQPDGDNPVRGSLAGTPRRGILNQGAFLSVYAHANESAPVLRGVAVIRRLACLPMASPSDLKIVITPPAPDPNKTTRELFDQHAVDPTCAGCHTAIDGFGFTFENFDGEGKLRTTYLDGYEKSGKPVDTATSVVTGTVLDGSYADSLAVIAKLGDQEMVRSCFARNLFRFASAQSQPDMEAVFAKAWNALPADAHGSLFEALIAYVRSPMFVFRRNER
jgi:hypothetical protein